MPATNTGLLLMDPYLTARSFSTPLTLLALAALLGRKYVLAGAAILVTGAFHPQMVVYLIFLALVMWAGERSKTRVEEGYRSWPRRSGCFPTGFHLSPATGPYREALYSRDYFFLYNWTWYHWMGMIAPLAILAWFWRSRLRGTLPGFSSSALPCCPSGFSPSAPGSFCPVPHLSTCLPVFNRCGRFISSPSFWCFC